MRASFAVTVVVLAAAVLVGTAYARGDAASASVGHARTGVLIGAIRGSGGPVVGAGGKNIGGAVTVFTLKRRVVSHQRVRAGQHFRFHLHAGIYRLRLWRRYDQHRDTCPRHNIVVRPGRTTHSDLWIGCTWP
jgi:hypothetical protein